MVYDYKQLILFLALDIPKPKPPAAGSPLGRSRSELIRNPTILVAMICATVSYALMNLVMTSSPLAVVGCGFDKGNVYLKMQGACAGCPSSTATLKNGIESLLKYYVPEVTEVRAV